MTIVTAITQAATPGGYTEQRDLAGNSDRCTIPANAYRAQQAASLPVLVDHDDTWQVGEVAALVRSRAAGLLAVLRISGPVVDLLDDGPWYVSPGVRTRAGSQPLQRSDARLFELSLTRSPATRATRPLRWSRTDIAIVGGGQPHGLPLAWRTAWDRAHQALHSRAFQRSDAMWIVDLDTVPEPVELQRRRAPAAATVAAADAHVADPNRVYRRTVGTVLDFA